jgi:hypothetical protein
MPRPKTLKPTALVRLTRLSDGFSVGGGIVSHHTGSPVG